MPPKAMKKCPECGVSVRLDKIEDHMKKLHHGIDRKGILTEEEKTTVQKRKKKAERNRMSRKEMSVYLVGLAVVIAVVIVIVVYNPSNPPSGPAPDFRLNDTEGSPFQLQSQHGHVVLLNLMDAKCSHCQLETRNVLVPLHSKYSANVMFISIDVQILGADTDATLRDFRNTNGATWRYFLDTDDVVKKYDVHATPTAYIIDRNGNIFFHREGETDYNTFVSQLEAALKGP